MDGVIIVVLTIIERVAWVEGWRRRVYCWKSFGWKRLQEFMIVKLVSLTAGFLDWRMKLVCASSRQELDLLANGSSSRRIILAPMWKPFSESFSDVDKSLLILCLGTCTHSRLLDDWCQLRSIGIQVSHAQWIPHGSVNRYVRMTDLLYDRMLTLMSSFRRFSLLLLLQDPRFTYVGR